MWILVKRVGLYDAYDCKVIAVSASKERLEEEAQRLTRENELARRIDNEIFQLRSSLTAKYPFALVRPEAMDQIEWQSLGFRHSNQLATQARQEVLDRYGKSDVLEFDHNLTFEIYEAKELT